MNDTPLTHDDVVLRIKLLADQLQENGFNFYLLVGKDSLCSCIARSNEKDLEAMIQSMQAKQPTLHNIIEKALSNPKK